MAIIGVCSSDVEKAIVTRVKDFTPTKQSNAERNITHTPEEFVQGGAKDFLRVLTEEVLPDVGELIKVDRDKVTLLGFSLGGLFGLYTMFTQASLFQTYLIISPSIWYNDKYILSLFPKFKERILAESTARPRVYLAAGGNECVPNHEWPGDNAEERRQVCDFCRMVDNVVDLAKDFDGIGLEQEAWRRIFQNFEGETHPRMIFAAASAAVRFALDGLVVESDDEKVSEP
jgi:predicted alpha/beta superfamily hydrolase